MFFKQKRTFLGVTRRERRGSLAWILGAAIAVVGVRMYRQGRQPAPLEVELTWLTVASAAQQASEVQSVATPARELFPFDPNHLPIETWQALGLTRRQAESIHKFEAAGGSFAKAEDVARLYVVSDALFASWEPFLRFPSEQLASVVPPRTEEPPVQRRAETDREDQADPALTVLDLNIADTAALAALPGIGNYTARRLLWFRRDLGGFRSLQQVHEVPGIRPENLERALPYLSVITRLRPRDLNAVEERAFGHHPYVSWNQARAVVAYRNQHGPFASWAEVLQVALVSPEDTVRWAPYFQFGP